MQTQILRLRRCGDFAQDDRLLMNEELEIEFR